MIGTQESRRVKVATADPAVVVRAIAFPPDEVGDRARAWVNTMAEDTLHLIFLVGRR